MEGVHRKEMWREGKLGMVTVGVGVGRESIRLQLWHPDATVSHLF